MFTSSVVIGRFLDPTGKTKDPYSPRFLTNILFCIDKTILTALLLKSYAVIKHQIWLVTKTVILHAIYFIGRLITYNYIKTQRNNCLKITAL